MPPFYFLKTKIPPYKKLKTIWCVYYKQIEQKEVQCTVLLKKVEQHLNWYYKLCTVCDMELDFEDKKNQCPKCKKLHPYPDRR